MSNTNKYLNKVTGRANTSAIKNYVLPKDIPQTASSTAINPYTLPFTQRNAKLPQYYIMPLQLQRITHDISLWREAITQAENALYPTRYHMQRMYADTILDGHTKSCMKKRRALTLLKDFVIVDPSGKKNEEATMIFKNAQWFNALLTYIIDAQFFGYSLIQLGDLKIEGKKYRFPQMMCLRRWNVEPDRQNLVSIPLQKTGVNFLDPEVKDDEGRSYSDWLAYIDTPTELGQSICGYGLLYDTAIYGIILKNNLTNNADYNQMFATPYRHAKTPMSLDEKKRNALETSLSDMGSTGWVLTDDGISIDFHESNSGNGYKSYESLEVRCQKMISKLILGHASAMDEIQGRLGNGGSTDESDNSPAGKALLVVEKEQDAFVLNSLNDIILPKLRKLGFPIPEGCEFAVTNDKEEFEARKRKDAANLVTAQVAKEMKAAGLKYNAEQFEEETGIEADEIEDAQEAEPFVGQTPELKNKLKRIYNIANGSKL